MKVGFTGTRKGMTRAQQANIMVFIQTGIDIDEVHHGDCIGADQDFHHLVGHLNLRRVRPGLRRDPARLVGHPGLNGKGQSPTRAYCSFNETRDPLPYLERDRIIVNETDMLIACPDGPERVRSGTWTTVRHARKVGKRVVIFYPDGQVVDEDPHPGTQNLWQEG